MPDKGDTCPRCEETINSSTNEYTCETCGTTAYGICCGYAYGRCEECGTFICTDCTGYIGWTRTCPECGCETRCPTGECEICGKTVFISCCCTWFKECQFCDRTACLDCTGASGYYDNMCKDCSQDWGKTKTGKFESKW